MFRRLVLRELYERSNEEVERQIADNYSFQIFPGMDMGVRRSRSLDN